MDRLTWEYSEGGIYLDGTEISPSDFEGHVVYYGPAVDRLAAYEDTGFTPEEITNLHYDHQEFRRYVAENARLRAELAEQQRETASCDYLLGEADIGARAAGGEIKELKAKLELVERERDKAVEDMKVGWLCRACIKRVKGKEWCNCPAVNFVNGPEKTTTCDNFEWRGTEGKA